MKQRNQWLLRKNGSIVLMELKTNVEVLKECCCLRGIFQRGVGEELGYRRKKEELRKSLLSLFFI